MMQKIFHCDEDMHIIETLHIKCGFDKEWVFYLIRAKAVHRKVNLSVTVVSVSNCAYCKEGKNVTQKVSSGSGQLMLFDC